MEKNIRRSDWIGGFLISMLFVAITIANLPGLSGQLGNIPILNLAVGNSPASAAGSTEFNIPSWSGPVATVCLILIACYLVLLLPRLNNILAGLISFTLLGILLFTQEFLLLSSSSLTQLNYPALLLIMGNIFVFSRRLFPGRAGPVEHKPEIQRHEAGAKHDRRPQPAVQEHNNHRSLLKPDNMELPEPLNARQTATEIPGKKHMLGRYTIEKELGKGAMGIVYQGRDPKINRTVAIKTLPLEKEFDESEISEVKARFFREAETAGCLTHPNIVTIYDVGEEQNLAYIAMEYLKGHDLKRFVRSKRLLPVKNVVQITILAAEALNYAHQQNVIHRDIKPGNIMFIPESATIKITDFGIARITDSSKTKTGIVLGTPSYMSPEQLAGKKNLDGRTDLFSLGVMFYQLLCGELPFTGESMAALMVRIAREPHRDIAMIRPDLIKNFPGINRILNKILEKDPEKRYQTGCELSIDLRSCLKNIKKK